MKKYLLGVFAVITAALTVMPATAASLEGVQFDDQTQLASQNLKLNGLGYRGIFIFKAYVAGLYLTDKTPLGREVLKQTGPKRLQLRMLMGVGPKDIKQALIDGMRKNVSEAEWAAMQDRVAQFAQTIDSAGAARRGDTINLDYVPDQGLFLAVNDVPKGPAIKGQDFYNAMLAIFVGDDPVDTRLRNGLLGQ